MATTDSKYTLVIHCVATKDGAPDEPPMMDANMTWSGLNYGTLTQLEGELIEGLKNTNTWAEVTAENLGQTEPKEVVNKCRRKRERRSK